ncbi:hypothetical protein GCM10007036_20730 [Alsobacter metallidurans]|uniref:Uncharacterized protein n=1 Tax=Alsobacter metallidurans TaxID=340221 RepID=A0A917MH27_9HYPH|nr:hypothetical protein [Alsobacter metallidurans]GGH18489.1 hypothetical protein GCM10007036_20730 [Alsobacter metallidurans]
MPAAKPLAVAVVLMALVYLLSPLRFGEKTPNCAKDQIGCLIVASDADAYDPVVTGSLPKALKRPARP